MATVMESVMTKVPANIQQVLNIHKDKIKEVAGDTF